MYLLKGEIVIKVNYINVGWKFGLTWGSLATHRHAYYRLLGVTIYLQLFYVGKRRLKKY